MFHCSLKYILILFVVQITHHTCRSQSIESVLKRHYEAMGQTAQEGIRSLKMDVTEVDGFGKGQRYELIKKRPYRIRKKGEQIGEPFVTGFDGKSAWTWRPDSESKPILLDSAKLNLLWIESVIGSPLALGDRPGFSMELTGSANIDRKSNYVIRLFMPDHYYVDFYIDKKDYLLKKMVTFKDLFTSEVDLQIYFDNYKRLGPYLFAYKMQRQIDENEPPVDIIIGEIAVGVGADNSIFSPLEP
jgi:hypothetical protein